MITAKNYVAQAIRSIKEVVVPLLADDYPRDAQTLLEVISDLPNAVHFALPDDGVIFDDELRGLKGRCARLPFPAITIEYFSKDEETYENKGLRPAEKRVIYCFEGQEESDSLPRLIYVYAFCFGSEGVWAPCLMAAAVPTNWDDTAGALPLTKPLVPSKDNLVIAGVPIPFLTEAFEETVQKFGLETATQYSVHDISGEIRAVLELCEALSCANVSHEPIEKIDPAVNARRVRDGKLPIYETRRLVIDAGKSTTKSQGAGGTHASPRQHLRRGHIRRLEGKNIWVNSCVVGDSKNGVIAKDYAVRNAARAGGE